MIYSDSTVKLPWITIHRSRTKFVVRDIVRKTLSIWVLLCLLALGSAASAAEQIDLNCVKMQRCCTISCVKIDLECCGCYGASGALWAEFLDRSGNVLGTATFNGNWCRCETTATLDNPVNSSEVCSVRLVKEDDSVIVTWGSLRVFCEGNCDCGKWKMAWKGDLWCWEPVPEPVMDEPVAVVPPAPVKKPAPPVVAKKPEPKHDFSYFPPQKEEEPQDEEVIVVIGNG